ncbi:hypothetical protein [Streptomyces sp. NPDC050560]|uniref:hypothetical protein n=1 Tax=Streptomyces sp. NPDC050560 TaxID=3365630 RepID=UPI0037B162B8
MDERSWWLALGGVMLLALVVTLVDGWGRSGRRPRGAPRADGTGGERPRPGEIWWTREPRPPEGTGGQREHEERGHDGERSRGEQSRGEQGRGEYGPGEDGPGGPEDGGPEDEAGGRGGQGRGAGSGGAAGRGSSPGAGHSWDAGTADGGAHEAPCVVLSLRGDEVWVVRITGRRDKARSGVIALPPGAVPGAGGRAGFVETDAPHPVALRRFRRRAGVVDPALWDQIRHLADPGHQ